MQAMRQAVSRVDHIFVEHIPNWIREGITEQQLFTWICDAICSNQEYGLAFDPIVAFGARGAEPHHEPTGSSLKVGETILIDCGATFHGWCSDCTRMFSLGTPSQKFSQKFTKLLLLHEHILQKFISGAHCDALDQEVRTNMQEDAPFFIHTLGHGVGSEVHVAPKIGKDSSDVLQEGDVVTCEPGIYIPREFGIRIEDQLLIRRQEFPEIFTVSPRALGVIDSWGGITYKR